MFNQEVPAPPALWGFTDAPMLILSNEEVLGDGLVPDNKESEG